MSALRSITFFMLVTERDCIFANYGIKSFEKIYKKLIETDKKYFTLLVYLNNLSSNSKLKYVDKWLKYPFVIVFDNEDKIKLKKFVSGETIISPEGISRIRDDNNENYDEIWSSELGKIETDYIATVDADFEILNADFYFYLINELKNPSCIAASTSYSPTLFTFDTYSGEEIHIHERNHTWFCIYKKNAFKLSNRSHFYYEKLFEDNKRYAYDSAAYFQQELRENKNYKFAQLKDNFSSCFIHYGAGSKNKSINQKNVKYYRLIFILANVGIIFTSNNTKLTYTINKFVRKTTRFLFDKTLKSIRVERSTYAK